MKWLALCARTHMPGQLIHIHMNGKQTHKRIIELFSFSSHLPLFYWSHRSFPVSAQSLRSSALWENSTSRPLSLHAGGFSVSNSDTSYKLYWSSWSSACTDRLCSHPNMFTTCLPTFAERRVRPSTAGLGSSFVTAAASLLMWMNHSLCTNEPLILECYFSGPQYTGNRFNLLLGCHIYRSINLYIYKSIDL